MEELTGQGRDAVVSGVRVLRTHGTPQVEALEDVHTVSLYRMQFTTVPLCYCTRSELPPPSQKLGYSGLWRVVHCHMLPKKSAATGELGQSQWAWPLVLIRLPGQSDQGPHA